MDDDKESASEQNLPDEDSKRKTEDNCIQRAESNLNEITKDDSGICTKPDDLNTEVTFGTCSSKDIKNKLNSDDYKKNQSNSDSSFDAQEGTKRSFLNANEGMIADAVDETEPSTSNVKKRFRTRNYRTTNVSSNSSSPSSSNLENPDVSDVIDVSDDRLEVNNIDASNSEVMVAIETEVNIPELTEVTEQRPLNDVFNINSTSPRIHDQTENIPEQSDNRDVSSQVIAHDADMSEPPNSNDQPSRVVINSDDEHRSVSSLDSEVMAYDYYESDDISLENENAYETETESNNEENAKIIDEVLSKPKPSYTWNSYNEIMRREHGLDSTGTRSLRNGLSPGFNSHFYSSRHVVERMTLSHKLSKHNGCVNCINFSSDGKLLCTGSDDLRIVVWDWAANKLKYCFKSGHNENVFQTKFLSNTSGLDIISASRDGQVRRSFIASSGGKARTSCVYKHNGSVHKLIICPGNTSQIISVGEDGYIRHKDLRADGEVTDMLRVLDGDHKKRVRLFSVSHHPFAPQICVSGCDSFVRVYDKRNMNKTVHQMYPKHLEDPTMSQVTCAVYNSTGSEILATYSDDYIYLFNNKEYTAGEFLHRYRGHYNYKTIKGVNFFGPNSEYVISGSDCGNIYFWDKNTEAILNVCPGDNLGVVNCLEPHPSIPVLATSGLDNNIKIWTPSNVTYPPDLSNAKRFISRNIRRNIISDGADERRFQYLFRQFIRHAARTSSDLYDSSSEVVLSSSSSDSDSDDNVRTMACHPQ